MKISLKFQKLLGWTERKALADTLIILTLRSSYSLKAT